MEQPSGARRRRRAVGPPGARPTPSEPVLTAGDDEHRPDATDDEHRPDATDDERLRRDLPPHHDRGV